MSRPSLLPALSLCVGFIFPTLAGGANIDDFSVGPFSLEAVRYQTKSITQNDLPTNHVLGGSRFVTFNALGPTDQSKVRVSVEPGASHLHYDADPGSTAANFEIVYGKNSNLHANLLADGSNALVLDFESLDFEPGFGAFDIQIYPQNERLYLHARVSHSDVPTSLILPYWAFNRRAYEANFGEISRISIGTGNGILRGDFVLTAIRTAFYPHGDYNFNGRVDQPDYQTWRKNFGRGYPYGYGDPIDPADGNRDSFVDAADYVLWRKSLSSSAPSLSTSPAVPEVSGLWLALIAIVSAVGFVHRRTSRTGVLAQR